MSQSRRNFIKFTGLGLAGGLLAPYLKACDQEKKDAGSPLKNVGLQLFTLRELLAQNPKEVLENIAKIGYNHVETYGGDPLTGKFWNITTEELKKIFNDVGLKSHSGHYMMDKYLDKDSKDKENVEKYVQMAHTLGQENVVAPVPPMHKLSKLGIDDYKFMAEQLNKAGEMSKKAGIKMGYHNHFWEFKEFGNGTKGLDILLAFTEPDLVSFELDLFWIYKAGESPQSYFDKYPGRFTQWHIKDMDRAFSTKLEQNNIDPKTGKLDTLNVEEALKTIRYTEVGSGSLDFPTLATFANESGLKYAYVEQDEIYSADKYASIKKSYDYMQKNFK